MSEVVVQFRGWQMQRRNGDGQVAQQRKPSPSSFTNWAQAMLHKIHDKANIETALYSQSMEPTGNLKVSNRGQMSLPAAARRRWSLNSGGSVGYLDLGEAIVIVPGGTDVLRSELLSTIDDEVWAAAADGFGDDDLKSQ